MLNPIQQALICGVRFYRWVLSPAKNAIFGPLGRCRFEPSCSQYALEALKVHGARKGLGLALGRFCRCHPWGKFGPDPVPGREAPNLKLQTSGKHQTSNSNIHKGCCEAEMDSSAPESGDAQRKTSRPWFRNVIHRHATP